MLWKSNPLAFNQSRIPSSTQVHLVLREQPKVLRHRLAIVVTCVNLSSNIEIICYRYDPSG